MKRVLTAIVLIPLVLLVLFKAPMWLFTLVVGIVAMGAAWEYLGLVDAYGFKSMKTATMLLIAIAFIVPTVFTFVDILQPISAPLIYAYPLILLLCALGRKNLREALPAAACSAMAIPYVVMNLAFFVAIRQLQAGEFLLLFMFIVVWSGDIFAYYAGRAFGKHKLAPTISPGKTWEGTIASFAGSVFLAHMLFVDNQQIMEFLARIHLASVPGLGLLHDMTRNQLLLNGMVLGAFVNVAAQLGDLLESMIKRGAGVKDSGTLLPGHGGILDRIDALLLAAPVVMVYSLYTQVAFPA